MVRGPSRPTFAPFLHRPPPHSKFLSSKTNLACVHGRTLKKVLEKGKTIEKVVSSAQNKLVSDNREYPKEVATVLYVTGRQKLQREVP